MSPGTLYVVSLGPGDPELVTLKAARVLREAGCHAVFAKRGRAGHAATIAAPHLGTGSEALRFEYPYTTEIAPDDPAYRMAMAAFYEDAAAAIALRLESGVSVALLCEGDAFCYGSAMHVFDRLARRYPHEVVPGVMAMAGAWASAALPIAQGDDVLTVLPGTLEAEALAARLAGAEAAVIMKVGSNLRKIRAALADAGRAEAAVYVERATMTGERVLRLADLPEDAEAPYFSLILVPGRRGAR